MARFYPTPFDDDYDTFEADADDESELGLDEIFEGGWFEDDEASEWYEEDNLDDIPY